MLFVVKILPETLKGIISRNKLIVDPDSKLEDASIEKLDRIKGSLGIRMINKNG